MSQQPACMRFVCSSRRPSVCACNAPPVQLNVIHISLSLAQASASKEVLANMSSPSALKIAR